MAPLDEIPQPWHTAMEAAGLYSIRDLAAKSDAGPSTVSDLIYGRKLTSERTLQAVAKALRIEITTIREWASAARGEARPFLLPAEANRLTKREREAVLAVVRAMLDPDGLVVEDPTGSGKTTNRLARVAELHPPAPDLSRVAARRGDSVGKRQREEQDRAAEEPQDPSH